MTAATVSVGAATCLFLGVMLHAATTDLIRRRIVNWSILALLIGYVPLALMAGLPGEVMVTSAVAAVLVFIIGFAGFCAGWMGGGDVKLGAVTTLWIGGALVVPYLLLSAVFGAVIAIVMIAMRTWQSKGAVSDPVSEIPYGPGMVLAALVLFSQSAWFAAAP